MPRFIVKLGEGCYVEWSTIVDAPISCGMSREQIAEWCRVRYGELGCLDIEERLSRVDAKGHSLHEDISLEELVGFNRAGPSESCLSMEDLRKFYCPKGRL